MHFVTSKLKSNSNINKQLYPLNYEYELQSNKFDLDLFNEVTRDFVDYNPELNVKLNNSRMNLNAWDFNSAPELLQSPLPQFQVINDNERKIVVISDDDNDVNIKKEKIDTHFAGVVELSNNDNENIKSVSVAIGSTDVNVEKSQSIEKSDIEITSTISLKNDKKKHKVKKNNNNNENNSKNKNVIKKNANDNEFKRPTPIKHKKSNNSNKSSTKNVRKNSHGYTSEGGVMYQLSDIHTPDGVEKLKRSPKWHSQLNLKLLGYDEYMVWNNCQFKSFYQSYVTFIFTFAFICYILNAYASCIYDFI